MATERGFDGSEDRRPLPRLSLDVGGCLLKDAFDSKGRLLLAAGNRIQDRDELWRLRQRDVEFKASKSHESSIGALTAVAEAGIGDPPPPSSLDGVKFAERVHQSSAVKSDATRAIAALFSRVSANRKLQVESVRQLLNPLIIDLLKNPQSLLSLVQVRNSDSYTFAHSVNVSVLTMALALHAGLGKYIEEVGIGSILHDIGKAGIPPEILHKSGPLDQLEISIMKQHPKIGATVLRNAGDFSDIAIACTLDHHENMTGTGYPHGKKAEEISLFGMITCIADIYDALTTVRPYRKALKPREALTMMTQKMGPSLEPNLLKCFISFIGYFPVGGIVELANGYTAMVLRNDPDNPTQPSLIQLIRDRQGNPVPGRPVVDMHTRQRVEVKPQPRQTPPKDVAKLVMEEIRGFQGAA